MNPFEECRNVDDVKYFYLVRVDGPVDIDDTIKPMIRDAYEFPHVGEYRSYPVRIFRWSFYDYDTIEKAIAIAQLASNWSARTYVCSSLDLNKPP